MRINYKPSQFELFPGTTDQSEKPYKKGVLISSLTLSLENIIILGILGVLSLLFTFSLGVEKGKKFVAKSHSDAVTAVDDAKGLAQAAAHVQKVKPQQVQPSQSADIRKGQSPKAQPMAKSTVTVPGTETLQSPAQSSRDLAGKVIQEVYTVQVATFKSERFAQKEIESLKDMKQEVFMVPSGDYTLVCVGKFFQKNMADNLIPKLRKRYKDCLVRRL